MSINFRGVKAVDKKEGSGSHNWGTFEDEMKAEEDKANTSDGMNDSAVEADPKEATDAPAPAAPAGPTAEDEEALARKVNFLTMSTEFDKKTFPKWCEHSIDHKNGIEFFFEHFRSDNLESKLWCSQFSPKNEWKITILYISYREDALDIDFFVRLLGELRTP